MATGTATLTATATAAVTLSNPVTVDELQLGTTPTINIDSTVAVSGLMGLTEGYYVIVEPTTTAADNGTALAAAYTTAKAYAGLGIDTRATVLLPPGHYTLASELAMDTQYVDIAGLTRDPRHVVIDGNNIDIQATYCNISGVRLKKPLDQSAANQTNIISNCILGSTADTIRPVTLSVAMPARLENCQLKYAGQSSPNTYSILINCEIQAGTGSDFIYLADGAVMRGCVSDVTSIKAPSAINAKVYDCAFKNALDASITNDIATPYNVVDTDIAV